MSQESLDLLKRFCLAHGAPSAESEVAEVFTSHLEGVGTLSKDRSGGVLCTVNAKEDSPRVMITGHMDEVGFAVQNITPEGFLQIVNLGGWWTHNLLSQRLCVKARDGIKHLGVVASVPPHFLSAEARKQVLSIDQLYVDIGADSKEHVEKLGISLGDPIVPVSEYSILANPKLHLCKAFDNRVGMAVTTQAIKELKDYNGSLTLLGAGTVQEEVGLRGAKTMAAHAKPDVALVIEGPPADDTPGMNRAEAQGALGSGPQIRMMDPSAIMNRDLVDHVVNVAKENKIPHQVTVRRSGGTDAGSFHLAGEGIPSIVLGVPARYIHTHNSIINEDDYLNLIKLVKALVTSFEKVDPRSF